MENYLAVVIIGITAVAIIIFGYRYMKRAVEVVDDSTDDRGYTELDYIELQHKYKTQLSLSVACAKQEQELLNELADKKEEVLRLKEQVKKLQFGNERLIEAIERQAERIRGDKIIIDNYKRQIGETLRIVDGLRNKKPGDTVKDMKQKFNEKLAEDNYVRSDVKCDKSSCECAGPAENRP